MTDTVQQKSNCPIDQMTFGEISRYAQGGYSKAILQAINAHVDMCNHCRAELERFHSLQGAGHHIMETHVIVHGDDRDDDQSGGLFLNENALAAYIDGTLSGDERSAFAQRIASSQSAYHHYSSVKNDLANPPRSDMRTPAHVLSALKKPVPVESLSFAERLSATLDLARNGLDSMLELKWPAPALAFALGLLVMVLVTPGSTTIMGLPPIAETVASSDHVLMGDEASDLAESEPVVRLPSRLGSGVEFYWAGVDGPAVTYKIAIYNETGELVYQVDHISSTSVRVKSTLFQTGSVYAVVVTAVYDDGSMRPVSSQRVSRT